MNRCPDCNKFVGLETQEPEEEDLSIENGQVSLSMRIVRCCSECGTEMKEATIEADEDVDPEWLEVHDGDGHDLDVSLEDSSSTESGGGRYAKNMIGFDATVKVTCSCGEDTTVALHGEEAASFFDEMV